MQNNYAAEGAWGVSIGPGLHGCRDNQHQQADASAHHLRTAGLPRKPGHDSEQGAAPVGVLDGFLLIRGRFNIPSIYTLQDD